MNKLKKIDSVDIPSTAKLCFVGHSKDIANYNEYNDLTFYFTTENIKENVFGKDWSDDYISFNVPHIYEENKDKFWFFGGPMFSRKEEDYIEEHWTREELDLELWKIMMKIEKEK